MAGFYRTFIPSFADICKPLHEITRDDVKFQWNSSCQTAFEELKKRLSTKPVLAFPRLGETFVVEVDASDDAVGGELSQRGIDGIVRPIAYMSTLLKKSQKNWSPHTKEAFALVLSVRQWYVYLAGTKFQIRYDHNPLVRLRARKDIKGKIGRWISELEEFDYEVVYIPGKLNVKADALSRNPNANEEQPPSRFEENIYTVEDVYSSVLYAVLEDSSFSDRLREEQEKDSLISETKHLIQSQKPIKSGRFRRVQKQLQINDDILKKAGRPVVPPTLRSFVLESLHSIGHLGVETTYDILKQRFYWPGMYTSAKAFVKHCKTCQRTKIDLNPPKAPLVPIIEVTAPLQLVSFDIAYLPIDSSGYRYILMIGDVFSKYVELVPLKKQTAQAIADGIMNNWILRHSCPRFMLSDQASNVDGEIIQDVCRILNVEKRRSSAYHSQGNGFAERSILKVREILRASLLDQRLPQKSWRQVIASTAFVLNSTTSTSTKCAPFEVLYGRKPVFPQDLLLETVQEDSYYARIPTTYVQELKDRLRIVTDNVLKQLNVNAEKMRIKYNKKLRFFDYSPGQKVWLKTKHFKTGENRKCSPRRDGPWTVIEKLRNGVNFSIQNDKTKQFKVVHHDRLKPAFFSTEHTQKKKPSPPHSPVTNPEVNDDASPEDNYLDDSDSESDDDETAPAPRYPRRDRVPRVIPGAVMYRVYVND